MKNLFISYDFSSESGTGSGNCMFIWPYKIANESDIRELEKRISKDRNLNQVVIRNFRRME